MKNIRIKYEIWGPVPTLVISVWEEHGVLHYSWEYAFVNDMKLNRVDDAISDISINELNDNIDIMLDECIIKHDRLVMDPAAYMLHVIDSDGRNINYNWSDDDCISDNLKDFVTFIGTIVGVAPFTPM